MSLHDLLSGIAPILDASPSCGGMGAAWDEIPPDEQRDICSRCHALTECADYVSTHPQTGTTWAGVTYQEIKGGRVRTRLERAA